MATVFTESQSRAVTESGNIIVSAGAGSGKTTVMIARIIDKLKKGASLNEMLIVTFTRASASDMRVKLTEELIKLKHGGAFDGAGEALDAMSVCNIGTLHSYCQKLIKTYFYAANVDPAAAVCEERESAAAERVAIKAAVAEACASGNEYFDAMRDMLRTRRSDDGVVDTIKDILDFALSMPDPERYLTEKRPDRRYHDLSDGIFAAKRERLVRKTSNIISDLNAAGMTAHARAAEEFIDYADGVIDGITRTSHRASGDYRDVLNENFKSLKAELKEYRASRAQADEAKTLNAQPYADALCACAFNAMQKYARIKERSGKIDYSDLEHGAYRVLSDPACMAEIAQTVKYVFIDEFQDVNPLQSEIAQRFKAAGAEMFLVGDVKQSIYGFRRCSPAHFMRAMRDPDYKKIALADNFRSSEKVIDFVNSVFCGVMRDDFGGVEYDTDGERLRLGNKSAEGGSAEFILTEARAAVRPDLREAVLSDEVYSVVNGANSARRIDSEAKFVADSVIDWIASAENPDLGSVAVLLRSVKSDFCAALTAEFESRGIKYGIARKSSVKTFPEAVALVDILRYADNRYDDVALYTALRSSMGGFSDSELLRVAADGECIARERNVAPVVGSDKKAYAFWQKVQYYKGELSDRLDKFFALREEIADHARRRDCADTLGYITSRINYFQYVYETGGNAQAVEALIEHAAERRCDTYTFLNYYDTTDFDLAVESGDDAVAITTVHASKGLEYDYVIVADTAHEFNVRDNYGRVLISENGVAVKVPDPLTRTLKKSSAWIVENALAPDVLKQEELRLFYVALTRAKKRLTVCGKNKNYKAIDPRSAKRALDFMRNVTPSAPKHAELPVSNGENGAPQPIVPEIVEAVKKRCEFAYPACALPIKTCVTALAHDARGVLEQAGDYTFAAPVLTADEISDADGQAAAPEIGVDARLRGTAYHRAMELADFGAPDLDMLGRECENFRLVDGGVLLRAISVMHELTKDAAFVGKERYFIVDVPASELYRDADKNQSVLVQGVIDLLIVDACGNATIVDYKTGDPRSLINDAYATQLRLYAKAVQSATPYKVVRKCLYSFASGEIIDM